MVVEGESPLPYYGLDGSFVGERLRGGESWDICGIVHRPSGGKGEIDVTVTRRTTARVEGRGSRIAIPADLARENVAMGLVLDNPEAGNELFAAAKQLASDVGAWTAREIDVDGEVMNGHEREFGDKWVAYYLTPLLIVSVVAPVALRPDMLELRRLEPDEVARMNAERLGDLEEQLLELCGSAPRGGETTALLREKLSDDDSDAVVQAALHGLVAQGLLSASRESVVGAQRSRHGGGHGSYEEDSWILTDKGRAAIGLPSRDH